MVAIELHHPAPFTVTRGVLAQLNYVMALALLAWYKRYCCTTISKVFYTGRAVARLGRLLFLGRRSHLPRVVFGG
jgi:hypothetical protein